MRGVKIAAVVVWLAVAAVAYLLLTRDARREQREQERLQATIDNITAGHR